MNKITFNDNETKTHAMIRVNGTIEGYIVYRQTKHRFVVMRGAVIKSSHETMVEAKESALELFEDFVA